MAVLVLVRFVRHSASLCVLRSLFAALTGRCCFLVVRLARRGWRLWTLRWSFLHGLRLRRLGVVSGCHGLPRRCDLRMFWSSPARTDAVESADAHVKPTMCGIKESDHGVCFRFFQFGP